MAKPWLTVALVVSCILLNACVSIGTLQAKREPDLIQRRVQLWLGAPREFLEKTWGLAQDKKDMGMGLRYLTYRSKAKTKMSCQVIFTLDITNTVKGGEWSGDRAACLRFIKPRPALNHSQSLVFH